MPLLRLETTVVLSDAQRQSLLPALSKLVADLIGKPEQYVMVSIVPAAMLMSGQAGPAAWVEVRSIGGLTEAVNRRLSQQVCQLLGQVLKLEPKRIYLNFTDVDAAHWGWNGDTFG